MKPAAGFISRAQTAFTEGGLSAQTLVERCIARIQAYDQAGPALNAVVAVNGQAVQQAAALDAHLARTGRLAGPLHGIPVVVKDSFHTRDMPTRGGMAALSATFIAGFESTATQRLRDAGAIVLAKTNMHEMALSGTTVSSASGQTLNPYDLTRTPGGSSGGTGAALAAGYALAGLGTDTVNSIRSPASANGLVGLRPTHGLVSRAGIMPVSETQDVAGPLAMTVADVACLMDVLAGFDADDPATAAAPSRIPSCSAALAAGNGLSGVRLGIMHSLFGQGEDNAPVNRIMKHAQDQLAAAGVEWVDIDAPDVDAADILEKLDVQKWEFRPLFDRYLEKRQDPAVRTLAGLVAGGHFHRPSLQAFLDAALAAPDRWSDVEYLSRLARGHALRQRLLFLMASHKVDALVYPLQQCLVVPVNEANQKQRNGIVAGVSGLPAITLPAGMSAVSASAAQGVPVGMDMLGRPFDEVRLLRIAHAAAQVLPLTPAPSILASRESLFET